MVHLLIIKLNSKEIDGVPVTGTPVISRTVGGAHYIPFKSNFVCVGGRGAVRMLLLK